MLYLVFFPTLDANISDDLKSTKFAGVTTETDLSVIESTENSQSQLGNDLSNVLGTPQLFRSLYQTKGNKPCPEENCFSVSSSFIVVFLKLIF